MADVTEKQNHTKKGKNKQKKKSKQGVKVSGRKSPGVKQVEEEGDGSFNFDDVLYFGGEKEDFEKLMDVNADEELVTGGVEDGTEKLRKEIENFLQGGGFDGLNDGNYGEEPVKKYSEKSTKKEKSNEKVKNEGTEKNEKRKLKKKENTGDDKSVNRIGKDKHTENALETELDVGKTDKGKTENKDRSGAYRIKSNNDRIRLEKKKKDQKRATDHPVEETEDELQKCTSIV